MLGIRIQEDETFGLTERDWFENYEAVDHYRAVVHEAGHRAVDRRIGRALLPVSSVWKEPSGAHSGKEFHGYLAPLPRADVKALAGMAGQAAEYHWIQQMQRRRVIPEQNPRLANTTLHGASADHEFVQSLISRGLCSYSSLRQVWEAALDWVHRSENWHYIIGNTAFVKAKCRCAPLPARSEQDQPAPTAASPPSAAAPMVTSTATAASTGGPMSGIDDVRAAIVQVNEKVNGVSAIQAQAGTDLEQATGLLHQVASTSSRPEPSEALGVLAELGQQAQQVAGQLQHVTQQLEAYAASL